MHDDSSSSGSRAEVLSSPWLVDITASLCDLRADQRGTQTCQTFVRARELTRDLLYTMDPGAGVDARCRGSARWRSRTLDSPAIAVASSANIAVGCTRIALLNATWALGVIRGRGSPGRA